MNHPEIAKIGLGNVDTARLQALDRHPGRGERACRARRRSDEIFTRASCRRQRTAEEAVLSPAHGCELRADGHPQSATSSGRSNMDLRLNGRVAMITGPAKGMGAAITEAFAAEGAGWRCSAATSPRSSRSRKTVKAAGGEAIVVPCDLTDAGAMRRAAAEATKAAYRRPHRHSGQRRGRLRPDRQDRRRDHAGRIRRHRHAQHERLLPHHARRCCRP